MSQHYSKSQPIISACILGVVVVDSFYAGVVSRCDASCTQEKCDEVESLYFEGPDVTLKEVFNKRSAGNGN